MIKATGSSAKHAIGNKPTFADCICQDHIAMNSMKTPIADNGTVNHTVAMKLTKKLESCFFDLRSSANNPARNVPITSP